MILPPPPILPLPLPMPVAANYQLHGSIDDGYVQVAMREPDDAAARVAMIAAGVHFVGHSMVPTTGTLHAMSRTDGAGCAYRWRC